MILYSLMLLWNLVNLTLRHMSLGQVRILSHTDLTSL